MTADVCLFLERSVSVWKLFIGDMKQHETEVAEHGIIICLRKHMISAMKRQKNARKTRKAANCTEKHKQQSALLHFSLEY